MRAVEFLAEYDNFASHRKKVVSILSKSGYKQLGSGQSGLVFGKKEGPVLKIIIPASDHDSIEDARNTFTQFVNFAKKYNKNTHLPKFVDMSVDPIVIDGQEFDLQGMERLNPISDDEFDMVFDMMYAIDDNMTFAQFLNSLDEEKTQLYKLHKNFYDTIKLVTKVGQQLGFESDIVSSHDKGNVMKRSDNTLVIMDPWVL